jgi:hypothetical protein
VEHEQTDKNNCLYSVKNEVLFEVVEMLKKEKKKKEEIWSLLRVNLRRDVLVQR